MSSAGGLSRRRVPAASSSTSHDDDGVGTTNTYGSSISGGNGNAGAESERPPPLLHAGSAFEGGSKVAYDPRDLEDTKGEEAKTGGKLPKLTIMEEVLLLGIKDKQVRFTTLLVFELWCL
jgi:golgi phosphoprotein 3